MVNKDKYRVSNDGTYVIGKTKKGVIFYFDIADYKKIKNYTWYLSKRGYIVTSVKRKARPMHKILLKNTKGFDVDHISRDKLDNRRNNLRVCTHQENTFNQKKRCTNTSGYTGVSYHKQAKRYEAYVHHNGKKHQLGLFHNPIDAAKARDKKAAILFGEFARLNFPHVRMERSG